MTLDINLSCGSIQRCYEGSNENGQICSAHTQGYSNGGSTVQTVGLHKVVHVMCVAATSFSFWYAAHCSFKLCGQVNCEMWGHYNRINDRDGHYITEGLLCMLVALNGLIWFTPLFYPSTYH